MANEYDNVNAAALLALGEVLNIASQVAEMQMSEEAKLDIYELLDEVADYYGVERREIIIPDEEEDIVVVSYTQEYSDMVEKRVAATKATKPNYLSLAIDNDKK